MQIFHWLIHSRKLSFPWSSSKSYSTIALLIYYPEINYTKFIIRYNNISASAREVAHEKHRKKKTKMFGMIQIKWQFVFQRDYPQDPYYLQDLGVSPSIGLH